MGLGIRIEKSGVSILSTIVRDLRIVLLLLPLALALRFILTKNNFSGMAINTALLLSISLPIAVYRVVKELNLQTYKIKKYVFVNLPTYTASITNKELFTQDKVLNDQLVCYSSRSVEELKNRFSATDSDKSKLVYA